MVCRDADLPPVFLVRCRLSVGKLISVLYIVPNIWFGVDGNAGATSRKIISTCPRLVKKCVLTEQSRSGLLSLHSISASGDDSGGSVPEQG